MSGILTTLCGGLVLIASLAVSPPAGPDYSAC